MTSATPFPTTDLDAGLNLSDDELASALALGVERGEAKVEGGRFARGVAPKPAPRPGRR